MTAAAIHVDQRQEENEIVQQEPQETKTMEIEPNIEMIRDEILRQQSREARAGGETGGAGYGAAGHEALSGTFLGVFWWLDELGAAVEGDGDGEGQWGVELFDGCETSAAVGQGGSGECAVRDEGVNPR